MAAEEPWKGRQTKDHRPREKRWRTRSDWLAGSLLYISGACGFLFPLIKSLWPSWAEHNSVCVHVCVCVCVCECVCMFVCVCVRDFHVCVNGMDGEAEDNQRCSFVCVTSSEKKAFFSSSGRQRPLGLHREEENAH
jgi:hypothetical protein